jgi:hypothetical protein
MRVIGTGGLFSIILFAGSYVALFFGWHPLPETVVGCYLHKKFHSYHAHVEPERLISNADCITVTIRGRAGVIRDVGQINVLHVWLAARADLWEENLVSLIDRPGPPLLTIRRCTQRNGHDEYIYANEDWLGIVPGKMLSRPICRNEWRELAAIVSFSDASPDRPAP